VAEDGGVERSGAAPSDRPRVGADDPLVDADQMPAETDQPRVRAATAADVPLLLELFVELAEYEQLTGELQATAEQLHAALFGPRPLAEALIAEYGGEPAGYAVFFPTFSSFLARSGMWLEDLYVRPAHRTAGVGRALLTAVAARTCEVGGGRLEWAALDWNELALGFYSHLGAERLSEWTPHRVTGDALITLASQSTPLSVPQRR
jgi:GNAT superfamily N-acetyltransferase